MTQKYKVVSENAKFHSITNNEVIGKVVTTSDGPLDAHSILTFSSPVPDTVPVVVTIKGPKGLYVALPKHPKENDKLIWSKEKYEWIVSIIPGSSPKAYQIYPLGEDLYWVDKFGPGNVIIVLEGKHIKFPENAWYLIKA